MKKTTKENTLTTILLASPFIAGAANAFCDEYAIPRTAVNEIVKYGSVALNAGAGLYTGADNGLGVASAIPMGVGIVSSTLSYNIGYYATKSLIETLKR